MASLAPRVFVRRLAIACGIAAVVLLSYQASASRHQKLKTSHLIMLMFVLPAAYVTVDHLWDQVTSADEPIPCPLNDTDLSQLLAVSAPPTDFPEPEPVNLTPEVLPELEEPEPLVATVAPGRRSAQEQFSRFQQIVSDD